MRPAHKLYFASQLLCAVSTLVPFGMFLNIALQGEFSLYKNVTALCLGLVCALLWGTLPALKRGTLSGFWLGIIRFILFIGTSAAALALYAFASAFGGKGYEEIIKSGLEAATQSGEFFFMLLALISAVTSFVLSFFYRPI